jgi:RNA polymerase sigma-70 factor (ECF subfamily)
VIRVVDGMSAPVHRDSHLPGSPPGAPIGGGSLADLESLFRAHYEALCRFVQRYVSEADLAEELVQDLFLRLAEGAESTPELSVSRAYLYIAARNRAIQHIRHRRIEDRWLARSTQEHSASDEGPAEQLQQRELDDAIARAIAELPGRCRTVIELTRYRGLSHADVAEVLGISRRTVEQHAWRALKLLRAKLAPYLPIAAVMTLADIMKQLH